MHTPYFHKLSLVKKSAHYIRRFTVTKISSNSLDHLVALNPTIITKFEISWEPLPPQTGGIKQ